MKAARAMEGGGEGGGGGGGGGAAGVLIISLLQYNNLHIRIDKIYS